MYYQHTVESHARVTQSDVQWSPGLDGKGPNLGERGRRWVSKSSPPSGILWFHWCRLGHASPITHKHHGEALYGSKSKKLLLSSVILFSRQMGADTILISSEVWIECACKTGAILIVQWKYLTRGISCFCFINWIFKITNPPEESLPEYPLCFNFMWKELWALTIQTLGHSKTIKQKTP